MTNLSDIMDIAELDRLVAERYITRRVSPCGRFTLHNYTEKATYDRVWTAETKQCRGIVSTKNGTIVAWPFNKFFNIDETEETRMPALEARQGPVTITEKMDGSMIAVWHADHSWYTSTRGAFDSAQARAAAWWLVARPYNLDALSDFTLLCEWVAPDNRVVLKYHTADLVLIGARHTASGTDVHYEQLTHIATLAGLRPVPYTTDSLADLAAARGHRIGMEGWVARWPDGFRVKIKTEDYLRLHRLISGFSPVRIREGILAGEIDRYISELPDELQDEARAITETITNQVQVRLSKLELAFTLLRPLLAESRKAYALAVQKHPREDWPYLFALADGRPITEALIKALDLTALFGEPIVIE